MEVKTIPNIEPIMQKISAFKNPLYNRDFLLTWEQEETTLRILLDLVEVLELIHKHGRRVSVFPHGLAVSIFRDKSTRTRFSFASAASLLGLALQELDETKTQIAHGETVRETATMISFLTQAIGVRDDMFIHEGHEYMQEVGHALDESFLEGILPQRPAVINLQCDRDHPTQSLADLKHLINHFGGIEELRGKKLAMTWAYSPSYGKPLSVPQGIIGLMTRFGMEVTLAHPQGYELLPDIIDIAKKQAQQSGGAFHQTQSMQEAFSDADVVYPKSWAPFNVMEERSQILKGGGGEAALNQLEKRCLQQNANYQDWECNQEKMALTRKGAVLYLHCLPADISGVSCRQGEVSADIFNRYRLMTYHEASHKPYVIAAMILLTRFSDPAKVLRHCL